MHDSVIAFIRTVVPVVVGTAVAWLIEHGFNVSDGDTAAISAGLVAVCIAGYYALASLLERKFGPSWGYLLGVPKAPHYGEDDVEDNS